MRRFASILVGLLVTVVASGSTFAQLQQPQPGQAQEQQLGAPPAVLVLPFTMLNNDGKHDWIGQGIQQNLQAELGRAGLDVVGTVQVQPMNRAPVIVRPEDEADAALKMATEAKADVVIFGNYHVVEQNVRVTGRVTDVASGQTVGFIKADGTVRDLLALEDQLSRETLSYFRIEGGAEAQPAEQQRAEVATQPAEEVTTTVVEEPVIYDPVEETSIVYSPRYYDDDIDDYDWIGAATYYPTYYPVGYYYPTYSYYYKPYCYRPWYWSSFSFGFHYGKHFGHHDYRHHHYRYARWHDDDDRDHWRHGRNARGSRGDLRDRGERFRDGRDDDRDDRAREVRTALGPVRDDRSPRRTVLAVDRREVEEGKRETRKSVLEQRKDAATAAATNSRRYTEVRGDSSRRPVARVTKPETSNGGTNDGNNKRVVTRDEGNKRVIVVPERGDRNTRPSVAADRDRAARLVKPDASSKNDRTTASRAADQDRAARLMGKDDPKSGRSVARSDPDRAASLLRGNERSTSGSRSSASSSRSSASPRSEAPTVRRSESSSSSRSSASLRSSSSGRETRSSSNFGSRSSSLKSSRSAVSSRPSASRGDSSFRSSASSSRGSSSLRSSPSSRGGSSIRSSSSSSSRGSSFRSSSSSSSRGGSSFRSSGGGGGRGGSGRGK